MDSKADYFRLAFIILCHNSVYPVLQCFYCIIGLHGYGWKKMYFHPMRHQVKGFAGG